MITKRKHWRKVIPLPLENQRLDITLRYNSKEMEKIKKGLRPECMEDKWFIFYENNILYLHRGWTGYCMYEVHFSKSGNVYKSTKIYVNRNENQYKNKDKDYDSKLLTYLIDRLLLSKKVEFPFPPHCKIEKKNRPIYKHGVMGYQ